MYLFIKRKILYKFHWLMYLVNNCIHALERKVPYKYKKKKSNIRVRTNINNIKSQLLLQTVSTYTHRHWYKVKKKI